MVVYVIGARHEGMGGGGLSGKAEGAFLELERRNQNLEGRKKQK